MKPQKIAYIIVDLISLGLFWFGFYHALFWHWSGFQWSPLGYETCGLEGLVLLFFVLPSFILAMMVRIALTGICKTPFYMWLTPLLLCIVFYLFTYKSLAGGIFCIAAMLILLIVDVFGCIKALRK